MFHRDLKILQLFLRAVFVIHIHEQIAGAFVAAISVKEAALARKSGSYPLRDSITCSHTSWGGNSALHFFWIGSLGFVTLLWVLLGIDLAIGVPSMPSLADFAPLADDRCPAVSVLFAARDEADKMPGALETFLS